MSMWTVPMGGVSEYRKRLFFLLSRVEAMGPVPPQLWRHAVEAFAEDLGVGQL